jgi:hypothetical protein
MRVRAENCSPTKERLAMPEAANHDAYGRGADSCEDEARCQQVLALWMAALNRHDATAMDAFMR